MHWGSLFIGVLLGMFGVPFLQQALASAKGRSA